MAKSTVSQLPEFEDTFTGVVIYGDKGYTGLAGDKPYPNVRVDGAALGKCMKRKAFIVALEPGAHQVSAHSENNVVHDVILEAGEVAYFRCNFLRIGGIIYPPAVLKPSDHAAAEEVVNGG